MYYLYIYTVIQWIYIIFINNNNNNNYYYFKK